MVPIPACFLSSFRRPRLVAATAAADLFLSSLEALAVDQPGDRFQPPGNRSKGVVLTVFPQTFQVSDASECKSRLC